MKAKAKVLLCAALAGAFLIAVPAVGAKPEPPGVQTIDDGQGLTPMSRMSAAAVDQRLRGKGERRAATSGALCRDLAGDGKRPGKRHKDAEECDVPGIEIVKDNANGDCPAMGNKPGCGTTDETDGAGNITRRTIKNKITVTYEKPWHRAEGATSWPQPTFRPQRNPLIAEVEKPGNLEPHKDVVGVQFGDNPDTTLPPVPPGLACDFHPDGAAVTEADGTCDMTKLLVRHANRKASEASVPPGQQKKKNKAFHADADGNCLETSTDGAVKCGDERRVHRVTETYEIGCDAGFALVNGHCRSVNGGNLFAKALAIEPTPGSGADGGSAMMGFTFAPPRLKWGLDYSEDICIDLVFDDFCFTVFSVFIGYNIDVAAGLRLPVDFEVDGIPLPKAIAGREVAVTPKLTPADFSAAEYASFCMQHGMADGWIIASCERFSFPEFFSTKLKELVDAVPVPGLPPVEIDGKEMVAQAILKAGVFVEVLGIPVVNIGINAGNDYSTMCTLSKMYDALADGGALKAWLGDFVSFGSDPAASLDLLQRLKDEGLNCSSFTTPFGPAATFPFLPDVGLHLPADCDSLDAKTVTVKGRKIPLCTGMALRYGPASLGLGLDIKVTATSERIKAAWDVAGDGRAAPGANPEARWSNPSGTILNPTLPVTFDNYENVPTSGKIRIDDLTYCLNRMTLGLAATLEFGGILGFLPDIASIPVYTVSFGGDNCGIPIPQHNATGPLEIAVPVENYALRVSATPVTSDPAVLIDEGGARRLIIIPGTPGAFRVGFENLGTAVADFDNLRRTLPPSVSPTPAPGGWTTTPDATAFGAIVIGDVAVGGTGTQVLAVTPFRHPRTAVGNYDLPVQADSVQAKTLHMAAADPLLLRRIDAQGFLRVYVKGFREPKIGIAPVATSAKPGAPAGSYAVGLQNFGNEPDAIALTHVLVDSNRGGCSLTTLGGASTCPDRSFPTAVQGPWTSIGAMPARIPAAPGTLAPEQEAATAFTLAVPRDWSGMRDTTYRITVTATSTTDPECPPGSTNGCQAANQKATVEHIVIATMESMTRYIGLELEELAQKIREANAGGEASGGALPIITRDVQGAHARAMAAILEGDLKRASGVLGTEIRGMGAFVRAIAHLPAALVADWITRANTIIADMRMAEASAVPSY